MKTWALVVLAAVTGFVAGFGTYQIMPRGAQYEAVVIARGATLKLNTRTGEAWTYAYGDTNGWEPVPKSSAHSRFLKMLSESPASDDDEQ